MSELGNRLRSAREEKNLTLDDLQTTTKIQKRYLVGIEEGNYSSIPGKFYVRAFIKQYAEAVGLDPEMIFEEYKNEVPAANQDALPEQLSRVQTRKELPDSASKVIDILPKILIIAIIIAVAVIIWVWKQNSSDSHPAKKTSTSEQNISSDYKVDSSVKKETKPAQASDTKKKSAAVNPESKQPKQTVTVKNKLKRTATYELSGTDKLAISLTASKNSWISIQDEKGKQVFQGTLKKGSAKVQDLTGNKGATVTIGNAKYTDIKLNGEAFTYGIDPAKQTFQKLKIVLK
ncbi:helix-turn-helix domain-containing protein [Metabacillus sp. RGM 3146]|uniref:helix-turn-helix domain-containing protein n=1 Tax=Metabacillus sp. RGM 3146 TaxID=3401092 RepID=UPI003B99EC5D